jgi:hypothetical protein
LGSQQRRVRPSLLPLPHSKLTLKKHSKIFLGEFGINDSDACLALLNRLMTFLTVSSSFAF